MKATVMRRHIAALSLTGLIAITLTGCFGDDESDADPSASPTPALASGGGGVGGGSSAGNTDSDGTDESPTDDEADASDTEPEPISLDGAACVYGTWIADNATAFAGLRQYGDEIKSVEGTVVVTYGEDGSLTTDYQDWLITAVAEGNTVTIHRSGTDRGTFSATDSTISMTDEQMGATVVMDAGDFTMAVDAEPAAYANAPYTCSANELVITTPDGVASLTR